MMKPAKLFLVVTFSLLIFACQNNTTIQPGDDDTVTLIINKGVSNPFSPDALAGEITDDDYFAFMWVAHTKGQNKEVPLPGGGGWGGVYNDVLIQLWSVNERENYTFADLGDVSLGGDAIPVWGDGGIVKYEIGGELRELTNYYQVIRDGSDDDPPFTGASVFSISGSPDVQDVSQELALPQKNIITNVSMEEVVDPNEDWVIEFKHPISPEDEGLLLFERNLAFLENSWENQFEGVSHVIIQAAEVANSITIPSSELQALQQNSSTDLFMIQLTLKPQKIAEIPLLNHDGSTKESLTVASYVTHTIDFRFQE